MSARVQPRMTLVSGGARSGKSRLALRLAQESGKQRCFIATAEAFDDEMRSRIARHRRERGTSFETVEAGLDLPELLAAAEGFDVIVVDCVTLFLSRVLLAVEGQPSGEQERSCDRAIDELLRSTHEQSAHQIFVTNEVGMGVVPESRLGRVFRDVAGRANQRLAEKADTVYLAAMGLGLRLRPEPVATIFIGRDPLRSPDAR